LEVRRGRARFCGDGGLEPNVSGWYDEFQDKEDRMRHVILLLMGAGLVLSLAGCASPKERKDTAEARWHEERVKLIQEYKDCVAKNDGDTEPCQYLLDLMKSLEKQE
jgi:hypothetical protein